MNKFAALFLLILLIPSTLHLSAQGKDPKSRRVSFELRAGVGPGFVSQKAKKVRDINSKSTVGISFEAGMSAFYNTTKNLSLGTGLYYQKRGGGIETEMTGIGMGYTDKIALRFHYLTIPVHLRVYCFNRKLNFYGGVGLNFCLGASQVFRQGDDSGKILPIKNPEKFGLTLDLGTAYAVSRDIDLGVGTNIGLLKAVNNVKANTRGTARSDIRFHTLMAYCAFKF